MFRVLIKYSNKFTYVVYQYNYFIGYRRLEISIRSAASTKKIEKHVNIVFRKYFPCEKHKKYESFIKGTINEQMLTFMAVRF